MEVEAKQTRHIEPNEARCPHGWSVADLTRSPITSCADCAQEWIQMSTICFGVGHDPDPNNPGPYLGTCRRCGLAYSLEHERLRLHRRPLVVERAEETTNV